MKVCIDISPCNNLKNISNINVKIIRFHPLTNISESLVSGFSLRFVIDALAHQQKLDILYSTGNNSEISVSRTLGDFDPTLRYPRLRFHMLTLYSTILIFLPIPLYKLYR